jgi:hypothetical protein
MNMTLDEAIKHCEEVAEEKENEGKLLCQSESASIGCLDCADEHRHLAEWLEELKQLREQKPCEDAISRTQALSDYADWYGYGYRDNAFYKLLKGMPSVTPKTECSCDQIKWERDMAIAQLNELGYGLGEKPRTGHWIEGQTNNPNVHNILCSCCFEGYPSKGHANSQYTREKFKYCPNCGAKMIEPQERSDKE